MHLLGETTQTVGGGNTTRAFASGYHASTKSLRTRPQDWFSPVSYDLVLFSFVFASCVSVCLSEHDSLFQFPHSRETENQRSRHKNKTCLVGMYCTVLY